MTDADLDYIEAELKQTTIGYRNTRWVTPPAGTHWANALDRLAKLRTPAPDPTPAPIFVQYYTSEAMQSLRTAGDLATPKAYSLTTPGYDHARFEVRPGDQWSTWSGERSQIQRPDIQGREGDRWTWRFDLTLDPAFKLPPVFNPNAGDYLVLWEHHHTSSSGSPPCSLQIKGSRLVWTNVKSADPAQGNYWTPFDLAPATPGATVRITVDALLSTAPAKAWTMVKVGDKATFVTGLPNLYTGLAVYPMFGIYRAPSPQTMVATFGPVSRYA